MTITITPKDKEEQARIKAILKATEYLFLIIDKIQKSIYLIKLKIRQ